MAERVERVGDTVRRPQGPNAAYVHLLLRDLEAKGVPWSPRFLGIDERGREVLTWIEGESGPAGWAKVVPEDGLRRYARFLRALHDATGVCHGDPGPWNVVWRDDEPVGIVDWDFAGLAPLADDVAYALEYVAPFRDDEEAVGSLAYPSPPDRDRRIAVFLEAYGTTLDDPVAAVARRQQQDLELVLRLAAEGHEPQATWVRGGYDDELRRRIAWTLSRRAR